jgi:hypothetical protein
VVFFNDFLVIFFRVFPVTLPLPEEGFAFSAQEENQLRRHKRAMCVRGKNADLLHVKSRKISVF